VYQDDCGAVRKGVLFETRELWAMGALLGIGVVVLVIGVGIAFLGPDCPWAAGVGYMAATVCEEAEAKNNVATWCQAIGGLMSGTAALGMLFRRR
jgi:nitrate reductase gamma subunit